MSQYNAFPTYQYDIAQQQQQHQHDAMQPPYFWGPHQMHASSPAIAYNNPQTSTSLWNPIIPPPPSVPPQPPVYLPRHPIVGLPAPPPPPPPPPSVPFASPASYATGYQWDPIGNSWTSNAPMSHAQFAAAGDHDHHQIGPQYGVRFQEKNVDALAAEASRCVSQKNKDQSLLDGFFAGRLNGSKKKSRVNVDIGEVRNVIKQSIAFIKELKDVHATLKETLCSDDTVSWISLSQHAIQLQNKIKTSLDQISSGEKLRYLKEKLKRIRKKRDRIKRQKQRKIEAKDAEEKRRKLLHEKLNTWLQSVRQTYLDAQMEKKMKKEADGILSEVRRKKAEATRTLALVKSVEKLRAAKKKSAEAKGLFSSTEDDSRFTDAVSRFESNLTTRLLEYGEEERTLQAMLDEERRETRDAEERRRLRDHEKRVDVIKRDVIRSLFGPLVVIDKGDPRFYYWEFYSRSERDLDTLIHVRREWDLWLVPNRSDEEEERKIGNVPVGWVKPTEPSSDAWAAVCYKDKFM